MSSSSIYYDVTGDPADPLPVLVQTSIVYSSYLAKQPQSIKRMVQVPIIKTAHLRRRRELFPDGSRIQMERMAAHTLLDSSPLIPLVTKLTV